MAKANAKRATSWNTTEPPHRTHRPVRLRYTNTFWMKGNLIADFVWSEQEKTFVEVCEGPDGIGLYKEDGWVILGWR